LQLFMAAGPFSDLRVRSAKYIVTGRVLLY
jgi:hypothetical protein